MWRVTLTPAQFSNQQALKLMLGLLCSKAAEQQRPTPSSLKFDNLSAILWVNPQRVPVSLARCLTPNDAHVIINQVTQSRATVSGVRKKRFSKSWLKARVLEVLDYTTLPTDTCPSRQNPSYRAPSGLEGSAGCRNSNHRNMHSATLVQ